VISLSKKALLIDGYVDEPAAFGVPPYISHYVRYAAGILTIKGYDVTYLTIDQIRAKNLWNFSSSFDLVLLVGGVAVPGKYVGGNPVNFKEMQRIFSNCRGIRLIAGPFSLFYAKRGGSRAYQSPIHADYLLGPDLAIDLYNYLFETNIPRNDWRIIQTAAVWGASIIKQHPRYPHIICEVELSRGCERRTHCSFCIEPIFYPGFTSRPVQHVLEEITELYKNGCVAFRFGRTANILAYYFEKDGKPCKEAFKELYEGIWKSCPEIKVLHHDNANPAFITHFERECTEILETIAKWNTSGDVLSFGVESFDVKVLKMNNIMNDPENIVRAIEIVNEIGKFRADGIPKLLPGINLLHGLMGETDQTFEENLKWLKTILEKGLLLRRINIRQVIIEPKTALWRYSKVGKLKFNRNLFKIYKEKIRQEIDLPMIKKVFPLGSVIRSVYPEYTEGSITFARQLGSYPVLIGVGGKIFDCSDVVVVDHGPRSLTAVKYPLNINKASYEELVLIPTIGQKRASKIILNRPFSSFEQLKEVLNDENCLQVLQQVNAVIL
jgi:radical SAM superfamily enzyme with C-terminal helix-hairpin-helix motif